jgi:hypothetical protein
MESLGDMLAKRSTPQEPEESRLLKQYVQDKYHVVAQVIVSPHHISLVIPSAALASTLRLEMPTMLAACKVTKKLHIRIN